ncbi:aminotransferase [hydrocarbon metagenome]|uniref:Aminotransferase n=1 Tax=hydrocarbon metagenome TaxID=938273 RepID=A0A0W8EAP2_9ZZZZ
MKSYTLESYLSQKTEINAAIFRVLTSGWYILGTEVLAFEQEFAEYLDASHTVGLGSGTDAIHVALRAGGIVPGDEVITVSHTAVATVAAIELSGATPVLVDIDPERYTMDPEALLDAINAKTRAVIVVHLYGHPADMVRIKEICDEYDLLLIEDCAQAHGARIDGRKVGTFGDFGTFSFYPTKNLGAFGDGGALVTDDADAAELARAIRQYGWIERNNSSICGLNSRLDELHAAILRVKLGMLDGDNSRRQRLAQIYDQELESTPLRTPDVSGDCEHAYHQYVVQADRRDELRQYLMEHGIDTMIHYPIPVHLQNAYRGRIELSGHLDVTEAICKLIVSLPMHPYLTDDEIVWVCDTIKGFFA